MEEKDKVRVLFLANIPQGDNRSVGGATMLSKEILVFLKKEEKIAVKHYQFRKNWRPKFQIFDFLMLVIKFPFMIRGFDVVSIHSTPDMNLTIGPILTKTAKIFNKKVIYHFFGGNFHEQYKAAPKFINYIVDNTIFSSDYVFFETRELINVFGNKKGTKLIWLPNARYRTIVNRPEKTYRKKFVFISRVIKEKGVGLILEAFEKLDVSYQISIYGPLKEGHYSIGELTRHNCSYKGVLTKSEIQYVLLENDVLLLPTFFDGEGYPGIIIEALSVGMPVIASDWKAINEIISSGYNGVLCAPKDSDSLLEKILELNRENFIELSHNAWKSFDRFNAEKVFDKFILCYLN